MTQPTHARLASSPSPPTPKLLTYVRVLGQGEDEGIGIVAHVGNNHRTETEGNSDGEANDKENVEDGKKKVGGRVTNPLLGEVALRIENRKEGVRAK